MPMALHPTRQITVDKVPDSQANLSAHHNYYALFWMNCQCNLSRGVAPAHIHSTLQDQDGIANLDQAAGDNPAVHPTPPGQLLPQSSPNFIHTLTGFTLTADFQHHLVANAQPLSGQKAHQLNSLGSDILF